MYMGHIVELASSDELYGDPEHPYTKALLSAIPIPNPELERSKKSAPYPGRRGGKPHQLPEGTGLSFRKPLQIRFREM